MRTLKPAKLTAAAFRPYGSIIHQATGKPMAKNSDITYWGGVARLKMSSEVSTGVLVNHKRKPVVEMLERHTQTPEILAALDGDSVFVVAKPSPKGSKKILGLKVFHLKQGEAVAMNPGCWHWVPFPVRGKQSTCLVVFASGTEAKDLVTEPLADPVRVLQR